MWKVVSMMALFQGYCTYLSPCHPDSAKGDNGLTTPPHQFSYRVSKPLDPNSASSGGCCHVQEENDTARGQAASYQDVAEPAS